MTFFGREPKEQVPQSGLETAAERMQEKIVHLNRELRCANQLIAVLRAEVKFMRDSRDRLWRQGKEARIKQDDFEKGHRE